MTDLSMFAVTAGTKNEKPTASALTECEQLAPIGMALLAMADAVDEYEAVKQRRNKIVAKLDDESVVATTEQRSAAEARASTLHYESERHRKEARRKALSIVRMWPELSEELQTFIRDEAIPTHWYDGVAGFVNQEPTLTQMGIWQALITGRSARTEG